MGKLSFSRTMMALAVATAALAGGLTGCASDDYYCDTNGCYYCDGVACRAAVPPVRSPCQGDFECSAGQVCTSLGCTAACTSDASCAHGWVCRGTPALCIAPTDHTPALLPGTCTTDAQCGGGRVCASGRCAAPPSGVCQFNQQCGANRVCVNQQCRAACGATLACPAGQACVDGACADQASSVCTTDAMCGAGHRCVNGGCAVSCVVNGDCAAGLYCSDQHACVADTRRQPTCTTDAQCLAPSVCLDNVCHVPCTTVNQCMRTEVSYHNCAPIAYLHTTQNFCQTDHEYNPQCARQADCTAGQSCVDGVCHSH